MTTRSETLSSRLLQSTALVIVVFAAGDIAFAQQAPAPETPATEATAPAAAAGEEATEDAEVVTVTGSRIKRSAFTSPSPVQVITSEQKSLEGIMDTADILQGSTIAAGTQQINNQLTGFVAEGGPGVNTVSLRGLGATRTLILLNGRRLSPAGTRGQVGAVDLNTLPESMIERIEILKDGGSSVYGSDAVAGVVNVITLSDVDGGQIQTGVNLPFDSGGE